MSKQKVGVAANKVHRFPFHQMHLTTQNFMQFDIACAKELPKSNLKHNMQTFVRCMPMKKPVMGSVQFHTSSYFVPFRTVWEPFSDFVTDTPHNQPSGTAIINRVPLIASNDIVELFEDSKYSTTVGTSGDYNNADFIAIDKTDPNGNEVPYYLTPFGRHSLKLLNQLGYRPYFRDYVPDALSSKTFSALPLLCAAKVYQDYFFPNQYAHYGAYAYLDGLFQRQVTYQLTQTELDQIFEALYLVSYDSDYFTAAFDNPVASSDYTFDVGFNIADISSFSGGTIQNNAFVENVAFNSNGTPSIGGKGVLTQYLDDSLKALTNYIHRHALTGSRALERYLADWGVVLSADKLKRCYKISEKHFPLQVADVMSQADTVSGSSGASLGEYAGKGIAFQGDFSFENETDEFGFLIVVSTIVPDVAYYQGLDRNVLHKTKLDFLNGDFDGLGTQPLLQDELFVGMRRAYNSSATGIFAFLPRYAEYKCAKDIVTGDFNYSSLNSREFHEQLTNPSNQH